MSTATSSQQEAILRAIFVSSSGQWSTGQLITGAERQQAFQVLQDFSHNFDGRLPLCLEWLQQPTLQLPSPQGPQGPPMDVTMSAKLYACEIVSEFLKKSQYAKWSEQDRLRLRHAVMVAAQHQARMPLVVVGNDAASSAATASLPLANKLASLLAALMVRDFPQRWTTCISDLFSQLWSSEGIMIGNKMCLEVLQLVAEDCTDSDFNSKISTKRRNDILIGLNEVSEQFLPLLFRSLEQISVLTQARTALHQMRTYLISNQQRLSSMTPDQVAAYQTEETKVKGTSLIIADTLKCLEKFCRSMPLEWVMNPQHDFCAALFFLLKEPTENINVLAVECLEQLALRGKLSYSQWLQWIQDLPQAVNSANQQASQETEFLQVQEAVVSGQSPTSVAVPDLLTRQLSFHRSLSRMLSTVVSSHIALVTQDKNLLKGKSDTKNNNNQNSAKFANFLSLLVEILNHPSGRVIGEQTNLWIMMLRDPQISKATTVLDPLAADILNSFAGHMVRLEWDDIEEEKHPQSGLFQASWEDEEEYTNWANDFRSKSSQLYKYLGNCHPHIASAVLLSRFNTLLAQHGNGEPGDHLDPQTQQLTGASSAVREFEGLVAPLENVLNGIPAWAANAQGKSSTPAGGSIQAEASIRAQTQASLAELGRAIVAWNPTYLKLKFRKAQLIECMRHFWKYDPSTLLQGIEYLVTAIGAPDEWGGPPKLEADGTPRISGETISLRKKSSMALVAVAKQVPQHLVPWLSQLSEAARNLLSNPDLLQTNRMHLYEFLTVVATAVEDPAQRSNFVGSVLADALNILESSDTQQALSSVEAFLGAVGITQAATNPGSVTDVSNVKAVTERFTKIFSGFNELLSVGKRCHEAAKKRPNGGIPTIPSMGNVALNIPKEMSISEAAADERLKFPDEGPVSLQDLAIDDPFVPLWPRILPQVLRMLDILFRIWRPEWQAQLLSDKIQRYALAMSDDDAFLCRKTTGKNGGVFGEGGTAGSVIPGTDRREMNLAPRWSVWLAELRNCLLQTLGLLAGQRALYSPEVSQQYTQIVAVVVDPENLRAMEHRHCAQYLKQFVEILMLSCPPPLYATHLAPIVGPVFEHIRYRLETTWEPILQPNGAVVTPLSTKDCENAAALARGNAEAWFQSYYARSCIFVGDLDSETAESAMEKYRVEMTRVFGDVIQSALALKGDWALVLANLVREEDAKKAGARSKATPNRLLADDGIKVNADGTPRSNSQSALDARKLRRINALNHFLFLENETVAGFLVLAIIQCVSYPDTYTARRITRICHRLLETVAWHPRYTEMLGRRMLASVTKNIVTEPKWMVGVEWDMINVFRDIYCRLVLGQYLQMGGQGAGAQLTVVAAVPAVTFEQAKSADKPLQGGGILTTPSELPHQLLVSLPGLTVDIIKRMDSDLKAKRAAKDQKDIIRDVLRVAADEWKENTHPNSVNGSGGSLGVLDRALAEESLLHNKDNKAAVVEDIPETLVTRRKSRAEKAAEEANGHTGLSAFSLS